MTASLNGGFGVRLLGDDAVLALSAVIRRGALFRFHDSGQESETARFERGLADWVGSAGACTVSSGTAGLRAALLTAGVKPGDTVLISAFTFVATASAVLSVGATPLPLDIGPQLQVDMDDLVSKLALARAVIPVYAPGYSSNVAEVVDRAHGAGVAVVEDACQALGVQSHGQAAGTIGDLGVYSFQQGKQLCAGEGGAVVSRDPALVAAVHRYADHGACRLPSGQPTWQPAEAGFGENLRITELQTAVLNVQLPQLDVMVQRQRRLRAEVVKLLSPCAPVISSVDPAGDSGSHVLVLARSEEAADRLQSRARRRALQVRWVWRRPYFDSPPFRRLGSIPGGRALRALSLSGRILAIPIPPLEPAEGRPFLDALAALLHEEPELWR